MSSRSPRSPELVSCAFSKRPTHVCTAAGPYGFLQWYTQDWARSQRLPQQLPQRPSPTSSTNNSPPRLKPLTSSVSTPHHNSNHLTTA
jgi:hypothetical protein